MNGYVIYRFFDADQNLLYVGITYDFSSRRRHHQRYSAWFSLVRFETIEHVTSGEEASDKELTAILQEQPLHNRSHRHAGRSGPASPPKTTSSFRLSPKGIEAIEFLAKKNGMSKTAVVEQIIRQAGRERGIDFRSR